MSNAYENAHAQSIKDPEGFWAEQAKKYLTWEKEWDYVLKYDFKEAKIAWFGNGKINTSYNCLDRHMKTWRKNKLALIWVGEQGDVRTYSYYALNREVCQFASVLRAMGINKGDRVTIYMPRIPEIVTAMLAYPLSRRKLKLWGFLNFVVVFTMFFGGGMVPGYLLIKNFSKNTCQYYGRFDSRFSLNLIFLLLNETKVDRPLAFS